MSTPIHSPLGKFPLGSWELNKAAKWRPIRVAYNRRHPPSSQRSKSMRATTHKRGPLQSRMFDTKPGEQSGPNGHARTGRRKDIFGSKWRLLMLVIACWYQFRRGKKATRVLFSAWEGLRFIAGCCLPRDSVSYGLLFLVGSLLRLCVRL